VKEQVRRALISESYEAAIEQNSLQVLVSRSLTIPTPSKSKNMPRLNYSSLLKFSPTSLFPS